MQDKAFNRDCTEFFKQLREMGARAREIITAFVESRGGKYTIDIDEDDHVWVGEEIFATALEAAHGDVMVYNSGGRSEYLSGMACDNILDLAMYLNNIDD